MSDLTAKAHHVATALKGTTLGCAESLTAGLVTSSLASVPGISEILRGGVVCYATDIKWQVLGVDKSLLARHGPVHPQVAAQLARGAARVLGAEFGLATTGVAGPGSAWGKEAGTVFVAAARGHHLLVRELTIEGDRERVRTISAGAALDLVASLGEQLESPS
ncbi:MAG: nicotinamide-nucleotide amidohydrolase family protein [Bowdeniella nasicola]|nr:nicotinamide-nucleotide amidohydrolase family protein [Bowdeniella nasicola]